MSTDLATLSIAVDSTGVRKGKDDLDGLSNAAAKAEAYVGKMAAAMAALVAAFAGLKALYDTNAEFQRLNAQLVTVQGSTEGAARAFEMIKGLAQTTPYELSEVTQAFIDLRTRGMDASVTSMTAYGDMASSFGRNLTDTIRAISSVAMGETEAIKSFGVQAQAQGDKIALTFRGQTEVIARSMTAVEDYFQRLATANFGDGMARQMATLGGLLSNLKDRIAMTLADIGNAGLSDAMGSGLRNLTQAIAQVTPALVQMAGTGTSAVVGLIKTLNDLKYVIAALAAVGLAIAVNGWIVALGSMAAPLVQATALTVALELATLKYATITGVASLATAGFRVAVAALASPVGVLALALGGLYLALQPIRNEIAQLNAQIEDLEARAAKARPTMDARDRARDLRGENDRLERALRGDKTVKIRTTEGQALVDKVRKEGGDMQWAQITADKLDAEIRRNEKLKAQMDAKNQTLREGGKLAKDAAQEAEREATAVQAIRDEYSRLVATEAELLQARIRSAKLSPANEQEAQRLASLINLKRSQAEAEREIADGIRATAQAMEQVLALRPQTAQTFADYRAQQDRDAARSLGNRYMDPRKAAGAELDFLTANRDALDPDTYIRAWRRLNYEISDVWATLEDGAVTASRTAADAIAAWAAGAKLDIKDMTRSILADLARIAANRTFASLVDMGMQALGSYLSTPTTTTSYKGFTPEPLPPIGGGLSGTNAVGGAPITVNVTVASNGQAEVTTEGAGRMGQALGNAIRSAIADECRPGGVVWETARA